MVWEAIQQVFRSWVEEDQQVAVCKGDIDMLKYRRMFG
jgi:hypothetical protein